MSSYDKKFFVPKIKILKGFTLDTLLISTKTFKKYLCTRNNHRIKKLIFFDSNEIGNEFQKGLKLKIQDKYINSIILDNKQYLYFSETEELYINKDGAYFNEPNFFHQNLNNKIKQLIILDNKDIVAHDENNNLSYYIYKNSKYEKFFNNINKYNFILGLYKLDNNEYCFLSLNNEFELILSKFSEDFSSKESQLKNVKYNDNTLNNILFRIRKNYYVIIGLSSILTFNMKYFEMVTLKETDIIYCALNITLKPIDNDEYEYLALIVEKDDIFYLQFYKLEDNFISESYKINLNECSLELKSLFEEDKKLFETDVEESEKEMNNLFFYKNTSFGKCSGLFGKKIAFDLNYDINNKGNIIMIIGVNSFYLQKRIVILLEVNLAELEFK